MENQEEYLTPIEIAKKMNDIVIAKAEMPVNKLLVLGILAGAYVGFGAELSTFVGHDSERLIGF
ncbi:MAG: hypothetical protein ACRC2T_08315, partial [Thermoguttaceae bacterium]